MAKNTKAVDQNAELQLKDNQVGKSAMQIFMRKMLNRPQAMIGLAILLVMAILAVLAPYICKYDYMTLNFGAMFQAPNSEHLLGTDDLGRDILSRILYGGRYSLSIGILSVAVAGGGGLVLGAIAGYFGGQVDNLIMRFLDIFHAIPQVLMAVCVSAAFGPGFINTVFAVGIAGVPNFARTIRAQILQVRGLEYVEAAQSINCSKPRIIFSHVIPNAMTPFIIHCTLAIANGLIVASTLSYIGLGVQPPTPEWGAMLSGARSYVSTYPYLMYCPGIFIMVTVLSFNLLGDAIRDALDPRLNK